MRRSRWCASVGGVGIALLVAAQSAAAQFASRADSINDSVRVALAGHLSGRARVALSASADRIEKGNVTSYGFSAGFSPFVGEHLQIGIAPSATALDPKGGPPFHTVGGTVAARYVYGGDARWRGYVGAFGGGWQAMHGLHGGLLGAQVGALYFLTPALAIRAEVDARRGAFYFLGEPRITELLLTLDPYVFGTADDAPVTPAGLGALDIAGSYVYERISHVGESGISGTLAPYLARWAQIGATGEADGSSDGITSHQLRGFGRLYLPVTARTQPFAEGFAETTTFGGEGGGLTSYGGKVGVRRMLNGNVALDIGVQRTLHPREQLGPASSRHWYREAGTTSLVIGMMTRIGRAR